MLGRLDLWSLFPCISLVASLGSGIQEDTAPVDFDRDVLPILGDHCFHCHGPDAGTREADLRLDLHDDVLFVTEPGEPEESELVARIGHGDPDRLMPPPEFERPLTAAEIETLRRWVEEGVAWESHWAYQPFLRPESASVAGRALSLLIDRRVREHGERVGMEPAGQADLETWFRRVTLDLTGLPPSRSDWLAFQERRPVQWLDLPGDETFRRLKQDVVEELLERRSRAEHRTREWLDIARYADTNGYQNDFRRDQWPWRDWVLRSFQTNKPYDQFILEQVAGDLLPDATPEQVLGTGFQRNHRTVTEAGSIDEEWRVENVADRAETTATAFMGLTLACARCHDHKYDALTQKDYYSFYAFFNSIDEKGVYEETRGNVPPLLELPTREQEARLAELDAALGAAAGEADGEALGRYEAWLRDQSQRDLARWPQPALEWTPSLAQDGISLPGTQGGAVDAGSEFEFGQDKPFTASLWLSTQGSGAVYSRMNDDDTYRGTDLVLLEDLRPAVHLIHSWKKDAIKVIGKTPLETGVWTHVAVVYDGSGQASGITLYLDGEPQELTVEVDALGGEITSDAPLKLGTRRYAGALRGSLLDVRFHGSALTSTEVRALGTSRALEAPEPAKGLPFYVALIDEASRAAKKRRAAARLEAETIRGEGIASAMVLRDLPEPRTTRVLDRGAYDRPTGDALMPDVPALFGGLPDGAPRNRLGLARWLVSPENPLTARVVCNRVWASFFGHGLVETLDDFGTRGERPMHQDLLDDLAASFVKSGWDLKALEQAIVLSETYGQSSSASDQAMERDPTNRHLMRGPRHRLDAEVVRDQALVVSGLLKERFGGPSVKPYQPVGLWAELAGGAGQGAYVPSEGDDLFRRSLYTYRKRTVPHPTLATFDAPGFELCAVMRSRTNTPLQALSTLNDVTFVEAARHLARRMIDSHGDATSRVVFAFEVLLGRRPSAPERTVLLDALARHLEDFAGDREAARELLSPGATAPPLEERSPEWAAYTMVALTLLNLDEALVKR